MFLDRRLCRWLVCVGKADQWRDVLERRQIRKIIRQHRTQMERFGYVPEGFA